MKVTKLSLGGCMNSDWSNVEVWEEGEGGQTKYVSDYFFGLRNFFTFVLSFYFQIKSAI